jgi:hypothetical protein
MTMIGTTYWTRRETAERALMGQAAFDVCKALRVAEGVDDARFYWSGPDTVVLQVHAATSEPITNPPTADAARTFFALADMANRERFELWIDPRVGLAQYEMAGR